MTDELAYLPAVELARRIRERELSAVELMEATVARIEARDPSLNAFVHTAFDEALDEARRADREVAAGGDLGPLHGVPTALKDLFDFKPGWPTTFGGIPALRNYIARVACVWAERVEGAGAILVGKTNSPVMGFRGTCDNPLFGPTSNPFRVGYNSGGSSGGAAAAVADGMLPFAEATDGGGSARIPAAWCGLYGHKPSWGRVPVVARPNAFIGTAPFVAEGVVARSVDDAAVVLSALSGIDDRDPLSAPSTDALTAPSERAITDLRIAYSPDLGVFPVDDAVAAVVREAVDALAAAGARVEEVEVPIRHDQAELSELWCRMVLALDISAFEELADEGIDILGAHRDQLPAPYLERFERVREQSLIEVLRDQVLRTHVYDALEAILADCDLIACPTVACSAVPNGPRGETVGPREIGGVAVNELIGWCLTYPANFTGHPAASVPAGLIDGGAPVGLQLIGRRFRDVDVLTAARAIERERPWAGAYRRCAERTLDVPRPPLLDRR